ncbi:hypothetical protein [Cellulomonas sp. JZ18]|uniref:hypothetical protein n=1 Tax=Cellulomonas sp. JZ18 TaxID=2654191 RepID=UPI0018AF713F|nr:hypothetical protein [Cellulomonas sp. JZ18]
MDILWLVLSLLALAAWLGWLWRLVTRDGLGDRRPPASHEAWADHRDGWSSVPVGTRD